MREVNSPIEALFNGRYRVSGLHRLFQRSLLVQKYLLVWDEIFTATWRARVCLSLEAFISARLKGFQAIGTEVAQAKAKL